jgi:hypothetical protein
MGPGDRRKAGAKDRYRSGSRAYSGGANAHDFADDAEAAIFAVVTPLSRMMAFAVEKKPGSAGLFRTWCCLLQVFLHQLGHLEHRDLGLAENFLQLRISIDQAPIDGVLQLVLLDVVPKLLGDFGTR